jgi:hypothetical protein
VLTNSNEKSGAIPQKKTFRIPQIFPSHSLTNVTTSCTVLSWIISSCFSLKLQAPIQAPQYLGQPHALSFPAFKGEACSARLKKRRNEADRKKKV